MVDSVPVSLDGVTFEIAVAERAKVGPVGITEVFDLNEVRETVAALGTQFKRAWESAQPDEATVEFGVSVKAKSGKLTSLIVEGEGEGTFKVSMTWKASEATLRPETPGSTSDTPTEKRP